MTHHPGVSWPGGGPEAGPGLEPHLEGQAHQGGRAGLHHPPSSQVRYPCIAPSRCQPEKGWLILVKLPVLKSRWQTHEFFGSLGLVGILFTKYKFPYQVHTVYNFLHIPICPSIWQCAPKIQLKGEIGRQGQYSCCPGNINTNIQPKSVNIPILIKPPTGSK